MLSLACGVSEPPERIVLIVVDTLRRDQLSVYGADVRTPNVERLARRGKVYEHAIASFHQTSMSMGALFTGRLPSLESGVVDRPVAWILENWCGFARFYSADGDGCIPAAIPSLGQVMRQQGYWTAGIASNPLTFAPAGFERGFDEWIEVHPAWREQRLVFNRNTRSRWTELRSGRLSVKAAIEALEKRPNDRFFLYVHFMDVHDWHLRGVPYREAVEKMDEALGGLLDHLEAEGLLEGAAIVLTSDHGEAFDEEHLIARTPRHFGNPSFEPVLHVPLIVVGAKLEADAPAIRTDELFRFLVRLAGAPSEPSSLVQRDELFLSEQVWRTYRAGRWKSFWRRADGAFHLVDLRADPEERHDVAARYPPVAEAHRRRITELADALAAPDAPAKEIAPLQLEMLRLLGYAE